MFESLFAASGLSLDRLKVLVELHESGSIASAAGHDSSKQSQFSRQLKELSTYFGCELAERQGKVLSLTPQGIRLAELSNSFFRRLDDFRGECASEQNVFNVAAGDSLVQWLLIPRLGKLMAKLTTVRFTTASLRTHEIVRRVSDSRCDFGLLRRNAVTSGIESYPLGRLSYVILVPKSLAKGKKAPSVTSALRESPIAMQDTDGEFTRRLKGIADAENITLKPALGCQSFPQTLAAVRSGHFAAVLPELAANELDSGTVFRVSGEQLTQLEREIVLTWNPRMLEVRSKGPKVLEELKEALRFS